MENQNEPPPPPGEERAAGGQIDWKRLIAAFGACGTVIAAALFFDACG